MGNEAKVKISVEGAAQAQRDLKKLEDSFKGWGRELGGIKVTSDVPAAVSASDVVLDFTRPEGTLEHRDDVISVRAGRIQPLPSELGRLPSHDFH